MLRRLLSTVLWLFLGLSIGYLLWGNRVGNLTEALNRLALEEDALRARLAGSPATQDLTAILSNLSSLNAQVELQAQILDEQARSLERLGGGEQAKLKASLGQCTTVQARLREQMERCLFEKADLEKARQAREEATRPSPRRGSVPVEESIELPSLSPLEPKQLLLRKRQTPKVK